MKKPYIIVLFLVHVLFFLASSVSADPRMETNNNFCHFILDPIYTDNEVFVAGCDSEITTIETIPTASIKISCENAVASGFGEARKVVPQSAILLSPGQSVKFTSDDSDTPCTMVESNGRAYTSHNWQSAIYVEAANRKGFVRVHYMLFCKDGQQ